MNEPIMMTPQEIINLVLAVCGAIITISGAGAIIIRAVSKLRQPNKRQDERLDKVEQDIKNLKERYREGNHDLYMHSKHMEEINAQQSETNMVIIESLQALTVHALNGDNKDALEESKKQLDRYLLNKAIRKED